jgi:predicted O-methyltransferase YrrM
MLDPADTVSMTVATVTVYEMGLPRAMSPFAQQLFSIPTHMTVQERLALMNLALNLREGFQVVEVGSYLGASTSFLGFAALWKSGTIHAVDPWTNDAMGAEGARDTFAEFRKNTAPFQHHIVPHRGFSADVAAAEAPIACDLLFIDGDHHYEAVLQDLRLWLPSLKPGGILAMHDIDSPPVKKAFEDVVVAAKLVTAVDITDRLLVCAPAAPAPSSTA